MFCQCQSNATLLDRQGLFYVCWWVVAEIVQSDGNGIHNDAQDVAPSPLQLRVEIQGTRNWWAEYGERYRRRQHKSIHGTPQAVGH
jgi:hypothetical protein